MSTTIKETHAELVYSLMKPGSELVKEMTDVKVNLWHAATGINTEAGELLSAIKKHVIYGKTCDRSNVIEELGDLEFYMEALRQQLDIDREDTLKANLKKLGCRYPSGSYSDEHAISRLDKGSESE